MDQKQVLAAIIRQISRLEHAGRELTAAPRDTPDAYVLDSYLRESAPREDLDIVRPSGPAITSSGKERIVVSANQDHWHSNLPELVCHRLSRVRTDVLFLPEISSDRDRINGVLLGEG